MGPSNRKESELVQQLRENVQDLDLCEQVLGHANLIRWIRARNHNVKAAEEMFRNYIKWFDEIQLESIFKKEVPKEVSDAVRQPICGFDKDDCPLVYCAVGEIDQVKIMRNGYKNELMVHCLQVFERDAYFIRRLMAERKQSDDIILFSGIADMEGLSWGQLASTDVIQHIMNLAKTFEANYPETVNKILVINAPRVFTILWSILKQFLSEATMDKIQIFGKDREQWQEAIYKLASKEQLPEKYGGYLPDDVDILPEIPDCIPKKRGSY